MRYMGEWKEDQKNGAARVVYGNGDRFEGSFKDGYRTGVGTVAWHGPLDETKDDDVVPSWSQHIPLARLCGTQSSWHLLE